MADDPWSGERDSEAAGRCAERDRPFVIAGETFASRLILGTGGGSSLRSLEEALVASGAEMATVALPRARARGARAGRRATEARNNPPPSDTPRAFTAPGPPPPPEPPARSSADN